VTHWIIGRCELLGRLSEAEALAQHAVEGKAQSEAEARHALQGRMSAEGRVDMLEGLLSTAKNEIREALQGQQEPRFNAIPTPFDAI